MSKWRPLVAQQRGASWRCATVPLVKGQSLERYRCGRDRCYDSTGFPFKPDNSLYRGAFIIKRESGRGASDHSRGSKQTERAPAVLASE